MKKVFIAVLFAFVLSLSTHAVAEEIKPVVATEADEAAGVAERIAAVNKKISEAVDKIYAAEGGKRDKEEIRVEYVFNSVLTGVTHNIEDHINKQEFDTVHTLANDTGSQVIKYRQEYPQAKLNLEQLAYIYAADGDTYFAEGKADEAIAAYTTSLNYKEAGSTHFQIGYAYMLKKEAEKGKQHFDKALAMDKSLESNYKEAMDYLKQNGIVK